MSVIDKEEERRVIASLENAIEETANCLGLFNQGDHSMETLDRWDAASANLDKAKADMERISKAIRSHRN